MMCHETQNRGSQKKDKGRLGEAEQSSIPCGRLQLELVRVLNMFDTV